jgi:hypothetical protein
VFNDILLEAVSNSVYGSKTLQLTFYFGFDNFLYIFSTQDLRVLTEVMIVAYRSPIVDPTSNY